MHITNKHKLFIFFQRNLIDLKTKNRTVIIHMGDIMKLKAERIGSELQRQISYILMTEIKDEDIKFVTITDVKVTNDLGFAKVYFTVLNKDRIKETEKALKGAAGFIRTKLCDLVDIRHMPELNFIYDESIEYGNKIEKIIEELHENE